MILARVLSLVTGYLFGLIQTAYIYGRLNGIDIREHGSGNAGTTNALRVLGKKAGIIVFIGDFLKAFFAILIVRLAVNNFYPDEVYLFSAYAGFGAVLGHNFPFYLKFRGGKGIAATGGVVFGFFDPIIWFSVLFLFVAVVAISKYVSLGSICLVTIFAVEYVIFALNGKYPFDLEDSVSKNCMIESVVIIVVMALMAIIRHKANIIRLINHEENKLGSKK